jgi:hypothetical protein
MAWTCPSCGFDGNDDSSIRCSCGQELTIKEEINYNKIGGGLFLVAIGLVITPLSYLVPFLKRLESGQVQIVIESLQIILFIVLPIVLLYMLFRRKRLFPKLIITYYLLGMVLAWSNYFIVKSMTDMQNYYDNLNDSIDIAVVTMVISFVWIIYFKISKRAKMTFIN